MAKYTFTVESDILGEVVDFINAASSDVRSPSTQASEPADNDDRPEVETVKPARKRRETKPTAAAEPETVSEAAADAKAEAAAAVETGEADEPITVQMVKDKASDLMRADAANGPKIKAILTEYKKQTFAQLEGEEIAQFHAELENL